MLREITTIKAHNKSKRRWFTDGDMDLYIWFEYDMPVQFQLIYDKRRDQRALFWDNDEGYLFSRIVGGCPDTEELCVDITVRDNSGFDATRVARDFLVESEVLEPTLADFIYARLLGAPLAHMQSSDQHSARAAV